MKDSVKLKDVLTKIEYDTILGKIQGKRLLNKLVIKLTVADIRKICAYIYGNMFVYSSDMSKLIIRLNESLQAL